MEQDVLDVVRRALPLNNFKASGGSNVLTKCPFHKGGEERKSSFSINLTNGMWHCFTCHEKGSLPWLLTKLGLPRTQTEGMLSILRPMLDRNKVNAAIKREHFFNDRDPFAAEHKLNEAVLGVFDYMPLNLVSKGFKPEVLQAMEVGFDKNNERVTYALRDIYGTLAGISGGATRPDQQPKYNVYQGARRNMEGRWIKGDFGDWFDEEFPGYTCENHNFLWNFNRIWQQLASMSDPNATLIIVEGFKACLWLVQHGYWNTVALMGSSISDLQQKQIHRLGCRILLCLDNDEAGRKGMVKAGDALWEPMRGHIDVANYPLIDDPSQPDDYHPEMLNHLFQTKLSFKQFVQRQFTRGEL